MSSPLRVLLVEDSASDAELIVRLLGKGDYDLAWVRVETSADMQAALEKQPWDLVISDYSLPRFSAPAALAMLQKHKPELPFIVVSGAIGEDTAVAMMSAGAHDYLMKSNLHRLVPAVERVLRETRLRQERRRMALALQESEERFRSIFNSVSEAIFVLDAATGEIQEANQAACAWSGYSALELRQNNLGLLDGSEPPAAHPPVLAAVRQAAQGEPQCFEWQVQDRRHRRFWVETRMNRAGIGGKECVLVTARDITERKEAERALRESEERFASAFEYAAIGMAMVAPEGRLMMVNRALCDLTGYTSDELTGKTIQDLTHPEDQRATLEHIRQVINYQICSFQLEQRYFHKAGHLCLVLVSASLIRDALGEPLYFITQQQDLGRYVAAAKG